MRRVLLLVTTLLIAFSASAQSGSNPKEKKDRQCKVEWINADNNGFLISPLENIKEDYIPVGTLYMEFTPATIEVEIPSLYRGGSPKKGLALENITYEEIIAEVTKLAKEKGANGILKFTIKKETIITGQETVFENNDEYHRYIVSGYCIKR